MNFMPHSVDWYKILCILVLFAVTAYLILSVYNSSGVGWDFLSRYLNGRTLASSYFYSHLSIFANKVPIVAIGGTYKVTPGLSVGNHIYFDQVWEPLTPVIFALLILGFGTNALVAYLLFVLVLLFVASYLTAKSIGVDPLVLTSLMVGPYVILVTIFYNGAEILGLGLALLSIGYAIQKRYATGIGLGLMGLARYDSLIIAPIALFVGDRKRIAKTIAISFIVTVPWLIFNFLLFGNPLQSYFTDLAETQPQANGLVVFLSLIKSIVWYPLILLIIAVVALAYLKRERIKRIRKPLEEIKKILKGQRARVLFVVLIFSLIGFAFTYKNAQGSIRLGYLVYLSVAVIAAVALGMLVDSLGKKIKMANVSRLIPYAVFLASLILLICIYSTWSGIQFNVLGSLGFRYPAYLNAAEALQAHGLGNCSVVSNAWPYLNFYNVTTYSPYLCNASIEKMPIVAFNDGAGVSSYCTGSIYDLTGISKQFDYPNFTIYLPKNYTCR
jgi:hypothetical protein